MKYSLNLFGYTIDSKLTFSEGRMQLLLADEDQASLKAYLIRVLVKYGYEQTEKESFEQLVQYAIITEKGMNGHLNEPRLKLPYEFQPDIKKKLIEAAELQDMSATQLLIRLIEKKYQSVFGGDEWNASR